jgi:hypothetical protein
LLFYFSTSDEFTESELHYSANSEHRFGSVLSGGFFLGALLRGISLAWDARWRVVGCISSSQLLKPLDKKNATPPYHSFLDALDFSSE